MSVVSPLNRVLGLGSAKDGVEHWWAQRLTAVALLPLGLWFVAASVGLDDFGHASVVEWMQAPMNSVLLLLTVLTLTYHSALGVQMVIEDYVGATGLKVALLMLITLAHFAVAVTGVFAILKVAFGAAA
jgi:succinate dehydrogenase / fumarate reductase membrane anchor subunit